MWKIPVKTSAYVMLSSDYSAQEPRLVAYVSGDPKMIKSFQDGRDIYASIASMAFNVPYEQCLEFHPETHEEQPDGKARRSQAKTIVLGICYGRSIPSIAEQLYGKNDTMTQDEKNQKAQAVYDAVLNAFPNLRSLMVNAQAMAKNRGYTETILGRRRHFPEMQLPEFEFIPLKTYVNPDVDPLDVSTLEDNNKIPERIVHQLMQEFKSYKYFGQIARRTKELYEQGIKVINNRQKIGDAKRQVLNAIIQGSAADQTKMAMLMLENSEEWKRLGGRLLVPVHDELIAEVPIENWKEGGEVLSRIMCEAAKFLPFPSKCDVTTTLRWYGLQYPCPYQMPTSSNLQILDEEGIKWVQYHLIEMEYRLPIYPDKDGKSPKGDAAVGVSGIISEDYKAAIEDYKQIYNIKSDVEFMRHIHNKVIYGL